MPSTYFLAPPFKWYFNDETGRPAAGAKVILKSSADKTTPKVVYSDPAGANPIGSEFELDGSGGTPVPMYWEDNGIDLYYVEVREYAPPGVTGDIITSVNNFPIIPVGGGGGPTINYTYDVKNEIINGNFHLTNNEIFGGLRNLPNNDDRAQLPVSPVPEGVTPIAPGGGSIDSIINSGDYTDGATLDNAGVTTDARVQTGWYFNKTSGGGLDDTISLVESDPLAGFPFNPPSNAPRFFRYKSDNSIPSTELDLTYVIGDVRSFAGEEIQITFDCYSTSASVPVPCIVEQDFGTGGGASLPVPVSTNFTFSNGVWDKITFSVNVPSISGKTIGSNRDDSLRIKWRIPQNNIFEFGATNFQFTLNESGSPVRDTYIYENYNETASKVIMELIHGHLPKTGDTKFSISSSPTQGWVVFSDVGQTLGKDGAATWSGEATRNLYKLIYNTYDDTNAPVSTGRSGDADTDFDANKTITFPSYVDRVIAGVNTSRVDIETKEGAFTHTLTEAEMPAHTHTGTNYPVLADHTVRTGTILVSRNSIATGFVTGSTGGNNAHNIQQPTAYMYLHVKL